MRYLSLIAAISFVMIAVFSFMGLGSHTVFASCAANLTGQGGCSSFGWDFSHSQIYHSFSLGLLVAGILSIMAMAGLAITNLAKPKVFRLRVNTESSVLGNCKISSWFSLQEKRDPLV